MNFSPLLKRFIRVRESESDFKSKRDEIRLFQGTDAIPIVVTPCSERRVPRRCSSTQFSTLLDISRNCLNERSRSRFAYRFDMLAQSQNVLVGNTHSFPIASGLCSQISSQTKSAKSMKTAAASGGCPLDSPRSETCNHARRGGVSRYSHVPSNFSPVADTSVNSEQQLGTGC